MDLYIDCEFDKNTKTLISLALINKDQDQVFYEVIAGTTENLSDPWLYDNVVPVLNKEPVSASQFQRLLFKFLDKFPYVRLMCDHPADPRYFLQALEINNEGKWWYKSLSIEIRVELSAGKSKIPHNALEDARALSECVLID